MGEPEKINPYDELERYEVEKAQREKAHARRWSLREVEELRENEPQTAAILRPFIEAANERGDFRWPWQMSRKEAREYLRSKGIEGEPWSTGEVRAVMRDKELHREYGDEVLRAQAEGRLLLGPGANKGQIYHFDGESDNSVYGKPFEEFKRELNAKLEHIDEMRELRQVLTDARSKMETLEREKVDMNVIVAYGDQVKKTIQREASITAEATKLDEYREFSTYLADLTARADGRK